jgi:hypothetical protein
MRKTHGFLNQAADPNVQVAARTDETAQEPGSSSKQQMEATFESRENPKRRKRSDDTHSLAVVPVKRTGEDTDKSAEPITTTAPQRDNLDTASLMAITEETHKPQTQIGSTDEGWQSHRNPKRDKVPHSPTPGTSSKQQVETSIENLGNRKRTGRSDDELPHPSTLLLDTTNPRPVKRSRGFTGESVKPSTTSRRNAVPPMTHETEKSTLTDMSLSPVTRITHGSHTRAAGTHNGESPTDHSPSQPDTKKCIQIGRDTYAVTSQPGTSYTSNNYDSISAIDSSSPNAPKRKSTKKRKPNRHNNRHHKEDARAMDSFSAGSRL